MVAMSKALLVAAVCSLAALSACSSSKSSESSASREGDAWQAEFDVDTGDLASSGTNPWFVLEPGYVLSYASKSGKKKLEIRVLDDTQLVDGVETRVVEERETVDDKVIEVSRNFFAISKRTNDVFYFGEDVDIYKNGVISAHEGAWRSGVNGARFGLMMPGTLEIGRKCYQEFAPEVAMDRFEIKSIEARQETPAGTFEHCVVMEETTPLEPDERASKIYARGVGLLKDDDLLLVSYGLTAGKR
jgi:hypothetical protein